jgi:hypothetical protein
MKVVSEEVGASVAAMPVEDRKKLNFGPGSVVFFLWRFLNVQNDAYSVLVVVPDDSLVCVCSVGSYHRTLLH